MDVGAAVGNICLRTWHSHGSLEFLPLALSCVGHVDVGRPPTHWSILSLSSIKIIIIRCAKFDTAVLDFENGEAILFLGETVRGIRNPLSPPPHMVISSTLSSSVCLTSLYFNIPLRSPKNSHPFYPPIQSTHRSHHDQHDRSIIEVGNSDGERRR